MNILVRAFGAVVMMIATHVQTVLRHSRLATTMDLYVHAYDDDVPEARETLDRALGGGA